MIFLAMFILIAIIGFWLLYEVKTAPVVDHNDQIIPGNGLQSIDFPESNVTYAKDQTEYNPLSGLKDYSPAGHFVTCWKFTFCQRMQILFNGKLWCSIMTFNQPLQPLYFSVNKHDVLVSNPPASLKRIGVSRLRGLKSLMGRLMQKQVLRTGNLKHHDNR